MNRLFYARLLAAGALLALSALAQAQYMWIDAKGVKQFSDRAPPASVPLSAILKAPRGAASAASMPADTVAADGVKGTDGAKGTDGPAKPGPAPTMAERNADYRKRARENLERDQKEKDERIAGAARTDNCTRARSARQSIDSGARIGIQDPHGERGFMSDEQRAVESTKIDRALSGCK